MEYSIFFEGVVYEAVRLNKHEFVWPILDMPKILRYLRDNNRLILGGYIYNKKFKRLDYRWIHPFKPIASYDYNVLKSYERAYLYLKQFTESDSNDFYVWIEDAEEADLDMNLLTFD